MPRVVKGERPGLVFNVSYCVQGQARYTHVPSILEMVGIPYVASGPLAHSLCLDKVVTKMILRQHGLPTPDFAVLNTPDDPVSDPSYPERPPQGQEVRGRNRHSRLELDARMNRPVLLAPKRPHRVSLLQPCRALHGWINAGNGRYEHPVCIRPRYEEDLLAAEAGRPFGLARA